MTEKQASIRGLDRIPQEQQEKLDDFIKSIPETKLLQPDGNPNPEWKVFYRDAWFDSRSAALVDAHLTEHNPTESKAHVVITAAAFDAKRDNEWRTVQFTAQAEARSAMCNASRVVAAIAGRDIGRDAALVAQSILVSDLDFPDKEAYELHAQKAWEVWQKGYALLGEVDGVLYVYCPGKPPIAELARK